MGAVHLGSLDTMSAELLALPDDPRFPALVAEYDAYYVRAFPTYPRSAWLRAFEDLLRPFYPSANARSLSLTARHYAPFYLAEGHDVP